MRHTKLHKALAMAAVLGGASLGLLAPPAGAVQLSQKNIGDVLIFPYYTVRAVGTEVWSTLLSITNTSDVTLAVKVKFYESYNSRDVLDFTVLLSPFDLFSGTVESDAVTGARFRPSGWGGANPDTTCVVAGNGKGVAIYDSATGPNGIPFSNGSYSGSNFDGGPTDIDRVREGYVEVIVEGHAAANTAIALAVKHAPLGAPSDCKAAYDAFTKGNIALTAQQFGEPINALKGSYSLVNAARGVSAGGSAVALANFVAVNPNDNNPAPARLCTQRFLMPIGNTEASQRNFSWDPIINNPADCPNLIAAQQQFDFNEPSLADAYPSTIFEWSDSDPTAISSYAMRPAFGPGPAALNTRGYGFGFLAVTEALRATGLVNQWAAGATPLGALTEWVVTHPTKAFYTDARRSTSAAVSPQRFPVQAQASVNGPIINTNYVGAMALPPFNDVFAAPGQACTQVGLILWDRDENGTSFDPDRSPGDPFDLCYEANVVRFNATAAVLGSKTTLNLGEYVTQSVANKKILGNPLNGWMQMNLTLSDSAKINSADTTASLLGDGMPAIGFAITQRTFGAVNANYGFLVDHSYQGRGEVTNVQAPPVHTPNPVWP